MIREWDDEDRCQWLELLRAGDPVLINGYFMDGSGYVKACVTRMTATQIIVRGLRYSRRDGRQIGKTWTGSCLVIPTPKRLQEVEAALFERRKLYLAKSSLFTARQVDEMLAVITKPN